MTSPPGYLAFGQKGEYERPAKVVGELRHKDRLPTLRKLEKILPSKLGLEAVNGGRLLFGLPAYTLFNMHPADAKRHTFSRTLLTPACDLRLSLLSGSQL